MGASPGLTGASALHAVEPSAVVRYVVGFVIYDGDVLLIEKRRPRWQDGKWNGVGGKIEPGESPLAAMVREFREEAGVVVTEWEHFATLSGEGFEVVYFRAFPDRMPHTRQMTDEALCWWPMSVLPASLASTHWLIPMATHVGSHDVPLLILERGATALDGSTAEPLSEVGAA